LTKDLANHYAPGNNHYPQDLVSATDTVSTYKGTTAASVSSNGGRNNHNGNNQNNNNQNRSNNKTTMIMLNRTGVPRRIKLDSYKGMEITTTGTTGITEATIHRMEMRLHAMDVVALDTLPGIAPTTLATIINRTPTDRHISSKSKMM